jgi:hypothetical protein
MLEERIFLRIGLLVITGVLCSILISCGSADTTPQPNLYTLEEALTLAAQTLQAESQVVAPSKTPTPLKKADVSNEQAASEENPKEPVVPVTGGNTEGSGSSNSGENGEGPDPSVADSPGGEPNGENGSGNSNLMLRDKELSDNGTFLVDPSRIYSIPLSKQKDPGECYSGFTKDLCGEDETDQCGEEETDLCGVSKMEFLQNYQISSAPSPTTISYSDDNEEDQEETSDDTNDEPPPLIILPPDALPPPIWPPGYEPPVFQLP